MTHAGQGGGGAGGFGNSGPSQPAGKTRTPPVSPTAQHSWLIVRVQLAVSLQPALSPNKRVPERDFNVLTSVIAPLCGF